MSITAVTANSARRCTTLGTFNALYEGHYREHATHSVMPTADREAAFAALLRGSLAHTDVLCLQECALPDGPISVLPSTHTLLRAPAAAQCSETVAIAYNSARLEIAHPDACAAGDPNEARLVWCRQFSDPRSRRPISKVMLTAVLADKTSGQRVAVTSAHLPWSPASEPDNVAFTLRELTDHVNGLGLSFNDCIGGGGEGKAPFDSMPHYVAGDFNFDVVECAAALEAAFPPTTWQDLSASVAVSVAAANGKYEKVDFMFLRRPANTTNQPSGGGGVRVADATNSVTTSVAPTSHTDLIKHTPIAGEPAGTPAYTNFCSDHTCIWVETFGLF